MLGVPTVAAVLPAQSSDAAPNKGLIALKLVQ